MDKILKRVRGSGVEPLHFSHLHTHSAYRENVLPLGYPSIVNALPPKTNDVSANKGYDLWRLAWRCKSWEFIGVICAIMMTVFSDDGQPLGSLFCGMVECRKCLSLW